ncbi:MAG TPA: protein kinase [Kofleriaceae bacterium]
MGTLGRYRVLKHLASGGMADVLLGRTDGIEGFERHVVLKRIRAEHARDRRFISMFTDEARLAAGLHHQQIVQVFDIGEANGEYFFAMEYIHGEDLRKLLAAVAKVRGHVPLPIVCAIVSAVASGLHYAHERRDAKGRALNIVHRDVSPSNILIGYDGAVKIVDFGIAKAALRQSETIAGSLKGKCSYMSPEQCKSEPIDRRSDVYGLGVLLYELATTTRLFKGDNEYLVMDAVVNGKFALPQVRRPDLPNELSSIIMRALATDPNRRYRSADELRVELDQFVAIYDLNASTATLASYMRKIFGERPEPWLDLDRDAEIQLSGQSWSDTSSRDSQRSGRNLVVPRVVTAVEKSGPTLKLGWESAPRHPHARNHKWLWAGVPVVAALAALGVWELATDDDAGAVAAQTSPAPTPTVVPIVEPESTAPRVVGPIAAGAPVLPAATANAVAAATATAPPAEPIAAAAPPVDRTVDDKKASRAKKARAAKTESIAAAPASPPAPATAPAPSRPIMLANAAVPVLVPPPAAPVAPPPAAVAAAPAPDKQDAEPQIATLSNATVSAAASDHSAQLAKCEGGAKLTGDVAVSFQIDAGGKVVRSQLASTIKNPKVAGCILRAVQTWKFAKPPSGAAKGVYSISYQ